MKRKLLLICTGSILATVAGQAQAVVTSSGTIGATLTLTNGCLINGSPSQNGINFGTLDFGTHPATFSTLSTQLTGASGGNTFTIQCTTTSYTVAITGNTNSTAPGTIVGTPGTPARYLINTTNAAQGVAYSLYSDSGFNNVVANNAALPIASTTGGVNSYTLYGRITGGGNSVSVVPGTYTDTINVSVTY
ncbi:spore coat protein U domain-containing protein [Lelliottia sp. RWM.1]|uniref:spore coat protein U domain-containing protein n=1 Tax=Lelliottia sp. RWM.1 TaxID=2663242 RepID=UPI00193D9F1B|nr:spore coat protein U domain-containing protein [Lelliottia sp. RWM.1]MBM3072610.1 fimbrial major subunit CsuA/B family protein [Lelliottia sp. RWM.1]